MARDAFGLTPYPAVTFVSHLVRQSRAHLSQPHPPRCPMFQAECSVIVTGVSRNKAKG